MALINDLVSHPRVLKEFYGLNISAKEVLEDMKQFVPLIKSWNENYLKSGILIFKFCRLRNPKLLSIIILLISLFHCHNIYYFY